MISVLQRQEHVLGDFVGVFLGGGGVEETGAQGKERKMIQRDRNCSNNLL